MKTNNLQRTKKNHSPHTAQKILAERIEPSEKSWPELVEEADLFCRRIGLRLPTRFLR